MDRTWTLLLVVCSIYSIHLSYGHTIHYGGCPSVPTMEGLNMDKLLGDWYAIKKSLPKTPCVSFTLKKQQGEGEYVLTETSQLAETRIKYRYSGLLRNLNPNAMTLHYLRSRKHYSFTVLTTDYTRFAAVYICNSLDAYHRRSILILSRNRTLEDNVLDAIEEKFKDFSIDMLGVEKIDQEVCRRKYVDESATEAPCYICASDLHTVTTDSPLDIIDDNIPLIVQEDTPFLESQT